MVSSPRHIPVLLQEVLAGLDVQPGAVVLDATVGLGGHAVALCEAMGPTGTLIGLDQDAEALGLAQAALKGYGEQVKLIHTNFGETAQALMETGVASVDAALLDLGVSSMQLDTAERGFAFKQAGPLDMRMNATQGQTAAEWVNRVEEQELAHVIREWGGERFSGRIAKAIVQARPLQTTEQLAEVITQAVPGFARSGRIHPATRTFQAIRLVINQELRALEQGLNQITNVLKPGGRLAVLSYHSLEDGLVKQFFKRQQREGRMQILTKKPIQPTDTEVQKNPRSRSARLRLAELSEEGSR